MPILSRQTVNFNNKATNTMCEFYSEVVDAVWYLYCLTLSQVQHC